MESMNEKVEVLSGNIQKETGDFSIEIDKKFKYLVNPRLNIPIAQPIDKIADDGLATKNLILFKIEEITFEEDAPRQEALENVFSSLRHIKGINVIYLILGNENGVNFYFGLSKNVSEESDEDIQNLGKSILKSSFEGNFRGSIVKAVEEEEKREIMEILEPPSKRMYYATLDGVPGINDDKEKKNFQGVDRLVDIMLGDAFGFMVIAHPISAEKDALTIEEDLYSIYDEISRFAKQSFQFGFSKSEQTGTSESRGTGTNETKGTTDTKGTTTGTNESTQKTKGVNESTQKTKGTNESTQTTRGTSDSKQTTKGKNWSIQETRGTNNSTQSSGKTKGTSESGGRIDGESESAGETLGKSKSHGETKGTSESHGETKGTSESHGTTKGTNYSESESKSENYSSGTSTNESTQTNTGEQTGLSGTITTELSRKNLAEWMKYFDEVLLSRWDYGHGKGIFVTSSLIWAKNKRVLKKLGSTATALFAGEKGNRIPFIVRNLEKENNYLKALRLFQQPLNDKELPVNSDEWKQQIIWSHARYPNESDKSNFYLGNWMSVKELAVMAGVPQKEVVGLRLKEEVEFGLNVKNNPKDNNNKIKLGKLVVSGNEKDQEVNILSSDLDKHIFITGVTGAGKTTTCQNILIDSGCNFLIIEPAKTEYRSLRTKFSDIEIFTIGSNIAPLKLNPFRFFEGENITSRVDMIKASIEAAFDMEAAIPQIIEQIIYDCYEEKGWNINTNKNSKYPNPFDADSDAFPTLSDILNNVEKSVGKHGFDTRLANDYIGSIKARLQGLILGAKGMMLNCCHSVDFDELLDKRVILELEELRDSSQKSLVIGFVLVNLVEAIRRRFNKTGGEKVNHITLIEEAHRLLSKPQAGDSNKQHGVEMFTDMLAEIRKYGESLIIADQIPNKLTPEVLKNTNTKIVHRIFAQDDKDAIGNTMALTENQRNFLSNLEVGRAIVFNGSWSKAVQVQMNQQIKTDDKFNIPDEDLKKRNIEFYIERWNKGIVDYAQIFGHKPNTEEMEELLQLRNNPELKDAIRELSECKNKERIKYLEDLLDRVKDKQFLFDILAKNYIKGEDGNFLYNDVYNNYKKDNKLSGAIEKRFKNALK